MNLAGGDSGAEQGPTVMLLFFFIYFPQTDWLHQNIHKKEAASIASPWWQVWNSSHSMISGRTRAKINTWVKPIKLKTLSSTLLDMRVKIC